jgi:DNA invertase Pin-like site-specific DNA recombinase
MAIALYARQSVERENSISCETQLEYCKSMLKPDERGEKILTFIDSGCSGGNINRDGFQSMMKQIQRHKISKVIVYKLDRISRSLNDFVNILHEFKAHSVEFVSSQESFDTSSPYGELIVKILMVFAEFERTSIINRITQAYAHRSEMGFYMGGRQPYGFEIIPAFINNIKTKKLNPIPSEVEQLRYIFEVYAQESVSLRRLLNILLAEDKKPLSGSDWTTSKLSTLLKNPIYVRADSDVYEYYERHGTRIVTDVSEFTGEYGAQLYGHTKHDFDNADWSDMKLVLLSHHGVIDSDIWLKCQRKLEKNKQIGNSTSNRTSWLSGKIICEKCGHTMTTIKGKINKAGEIRRYFNCTGKSHKKNCKGPKVSIYAEDLENMVYDCISVQLSELNETKHKKKTVSAAEINDMKLRIKEAEKAEKQLIDTMLSGGFNEDLLKLANQKATQLKQDKAALYERLEELKSRESETEIAVNLAGTWKNADYTRKKEVAMLILHKIIIDENGDTKVIWNL